jgi:hypothetical protein
MAQEERKEMDHPVSGPGGRQEAADNGYAGGDWQEKGQERTLATKLAVPDRWKKSVVNSAKKASWVLIGVDPELPACQEEVEVTNGEKDHQQLTVKGGVFLHDDGQTS